VALSTGMVAGGLYDGTPEGWCTPNVPWGDLIFWVLPVSISFLCNLVLYIWVSISLHRKQQQSPGEGMKRLADVVRKRISLYVLVYLVCWAPDIASHLFSYFKDCLVVWEDVVPALLTPAQGFLNCIVYTLANPVLRKRFSWTNLLFAFFVSPFLLLPAVIFATALNFGYLLQRVKLQNMTTSVYGRPEFNSDDYDYDEREGLGTETARRLASTHSTNW